MKKSRAFLVLAAALCVLAIPVGLPAAGADGSWEIRMATIAPKSSKPMRILRAWDMSMQEKTGGRLKLKIYPGGIQGDERDVIRKIKAKQVDSTTLTSVGLGQIVRSASVLQVPGLFKSYKELSAVRSAMDADWRKQFDDAGYQLLGWFDVGFGRVFSNTPVEKPSDFKKTRPWVWRDDPVYPELMKITGANGIALGLPEVFPALQTKMVDTIVTTPIACLGLQWFNNITHMSKQADVALVGATLITNEQFKTMPPDVQTALLDTGKLAHQKALELIESEEVAAYNTLKARGIKEVDQSKYAAEWDKTYAQLQKQLTGKLFSQDQLERVKAAVAGARK
jgi:TRAP-type C4-dicarboxylate transport system substrate-binding protein